MPSCSECGRKVMLAYRCRYCGEGFCEEHRLPERHQCPGIEAAKEEARIGRARAGDRRGDFGAWVDSASSTRFYLEGHVFEKTLSGDIQIDNGRFSRDEAREIAEMLSSDNPFLKLNATLAIWAKNGTIYVGLLVAAVILLAVVIVILKV
ncbi:MAG: AN1-type zinc finger domain-containing protein [Candidatus Brockarchaeota archaeon]|nr:AN1-type zinc finger domain-containing protein [Candidatus Brockarchaeota archaeon]